MSWWAPEIWRRQLPSVTTGLAVPNDLHPGSHDPRAWPIRWRYRAQIGGPVDAELSGMRPGGTIVFLLTGESPHEGRLGLHYKGCRWAARPVRGRAGSGSISFMAENKTRTSAWLGL